VVRKRKHINIIYRWLAHIKIKSMYPFEEWAVRENTKSCSLKYKTRKNYKIFYKNRIYRFANLNFSTFGQNTKMMVRKCKDINIIYRWIAHIKFKSVWSFEESPVRESPKNSLVAHLYWMCRPTYLLYE